MDTSKAEKIASFNVNDPGVNNGNLFGLPFNYEESEVIVLPVPWEVTVSYNAGTAKGPQAMLEASLQVDLFDADLPDAWQHGIYMMGVSETWKTKSKQLRLQAQEHFRMLESGVSEGSTEAQKKINEATDDLRKWVFEQTKTFLDKGKLVILAGGDHSTPLGYMQALSTKHESFGILQIDAHADLRNSYEGFTHSHASIMFNAIQNDGISHLVQVGLRDVCQEEIDLINTNNKIKAFFYSDIQNSIYSGQTWKKVSSEIVEALPEYVYLSIDIDGLDPKYCPNTGTPVPGGLELEQLFFLVRELIKSGRKIIGFDLVEVAPGQDEWDANVGIRLLYKICNLMIKSNMQ